MSFFKAEPMPVWSCTACDADVPGDDCGAVDVDSGAVWCIPCAEVLP